jgi:hypothetical protein
MTLDAAVLLEMAVHLDSMAFTDIKNDPEVEVEAEALLVTSIQSLEPVAVHRVVVQIMATEGIDRPTETGVVGDCKS